MNDQAKQDTVKSEPASAGERKPLWQRTLQGVWRAVFTVTGMAVLLIILASALRGRDAIVISTIVVEHAASEPTTDDGRLIQRLQAELVRLSAITRSAQEVQFTVAEEVADLNFAVLTSLEDGARALATSAELTTSNITLQGLTVDVGLVSQLTQRLLGQGRLTVRINASQMAPQVIATSTDGRAWSIATSELHQLVPGLAPPPKPTGEFLVLESQKLKTARLRLKDERLRTDALLDVLALKMLLDKGRTPLSERAFLRAAEHFRFRAALHGNALDGSGLLAPFVPNFAEQRRTEYARLSSQQDCPLPLTDECLQPEMQAQAEADATTFQPFKDPLLRVLLDLRNASYLESNKVYLHPSYGNLREWCEVVRRQILELAAFDESLDFWGNEERVYAKQLELVGRTSLTSETPKWQELRRDLMVGISLRALLANVCKYYSEPTRIPYPLPELVPNVLTLLADTVPSPQHQAARLFALKMAVWYDPASQARRLQEWETVAPRDPQLMAARAWIATRTHRPQEADRQLTRVFAQSAVPLDVTLLLQQADAGSRVPATSPFGRCAQQKARGARLAARWHLRQQDLLWAYGRDAVPGRWVLTADEEAPERLDQDDLLRLLSQPCPT